MRKVILASVLALVAGAGLWHLLQYDTGYVLIVVAGKTIEMRLIFALFSLLIIVWLARVIWRLLRGVSHALQFGWGTVSRRRMLNAERRTQRGLVSFIEGDWQGAQHDLLRAARKINTPLVHYLAAARSAHELGQHDRAQELLTKAEQIAPPNSPAILVSQARMLFDERKYEASLGALHRAKSAAPDHPAVLDLLQKVYAALADWQALELLLPQLRTHKILSEAELKSLEQQIYAGLLHQAGKSVGKQGSTALEELNHQWQQLPKAARKQPELVLVYARYLVLAGAHDTVEPLLRQTLKDHWNPSLVELYGLLAPTDRQSQLQHALRWEQDRPDDHELHLALGRISLRNELWGQARDHFLNSLRLKPTPAAYAELGRLFAHLGEHQQSSDYYQRGLLMITHGLPSLPMPNH